MQTFLSKSSVVLADAALGQVDAIASITNLKDLQGDVILPGAYSKVVNGSRMPRVCWMHQNGTQGQPLVVLGKATRLEELMPGDSRLPADLYSAGYGALLASLQMNMQSEAGREAYSQLSGGFIDELSVGFLPGASGYDNKSGANLIKEIDDLIEISLVLRGAAATSDGRIRTSVLATKGARESRTRDDDLLALAAVLAVAKR